MSLRQSIVVGIAFCLVLSSYTLAPSQALLITPTFIPTLLAHPTRAPSPTPQPSPTSPIQTGKDSATLIGENYPDYSVIAPGEQFVKTLDI